MKAAHRQALCAAGALALVALGFGVAGSTALSLAGERARLGQLTEARDALAQREARLARRTGRDPAASPQIEARSLTLAGAALQQRLEAAVTAARGRLVSSRVDLAPGGEAGGVALAAELNLAPEDLQALLYDLETGRPYIFVDSVAARAPETGGAMPVALTVSGQWSGAK